MKKLRSLALLLVVLFNLVIPPVNVYAQITEDSLSYDFQAKSQNKDDLIRVIDYQVYDGDTADFILDRRVEPSIKARFLLIDAPEMNQNVPYKKESRDRVNELLDKAKHIHIEYEGEKKDDYGRDLVHVWVDGLLLQEILVAEGLATARYIEDYIPDSHYVETIYASQDYAKEHNLNIWKDGDPTYLAKAEYASKADSTTSNSNQEKNSNEEAHSCDVPTTEKTVYIAPHSGEKYHYDLNCHGLSNADSIEKITLSDAQAQGYTLCGWED